MISDISQYEEIEMIPSYLLGSHKSSDQSFCWEEKLPNNENISKFTFLTYNIWFDKHNFYQRN